MRECKPQGLLAPINYINLVGLAEEQAHKLLLAAASGKRTKPATAPPFPGVSGPAFPGTSERPLDPPTLPGKSARGQAEQPTLAGQYALTRWLPETLSRNLYFTGRDAELKQLHDTFTKKSGIVTQVLAGLFGTGKTETALEYAHRYQQEYQVIFWVQAETRELLEGDLAKIAKKLQLPEHQAQKPEEIMAAVTRWLEVHSGWLLVLDNVRNIALARELMPRQGSGHMLLTASDQVVGTVGQMVRLEALSTNEAVHFLLRRADRLSLDAPLSAAEAEDYAQAKAIVEALGNLLLALDQAGAYIRKIRCGLDEYLDLLKTHRHRQYILNERGEDMISHAKSVAVTFSIAFKQIKQANPAADLLLRLCAFLHSDAIPEALFRDNANAHPPALQAAASDLLQWHMVLGELRRFSLIEHQAETRTLSVHRLVQMVLQDDMSEDTRRAWAHHATRVVGLAFPQHIEFANWGRCQQVLPHALVCAEYIEKWNMVSVQAAWLLNKAGYYLDERAQYAKAQPLYERALKIREQVSGKNHPDVAVILNNLAANHEAQGDFTESQRLYERARVILQPADERFLLDLARTLNNLSVIYFKQGQYAKAQPMCEQALAIRKQKLSPDHPDRAVTLSNLAAIYAEQKLYTKAEQHYREALAILEKKYGPDHPAVATCQNNLAQLYAAQGRYDVAQHLYEWVLPIFQKELGPDHPDVASILNNLAELSVAQGKYPEAQQRYQQALAIYEQSLPDHPETIACLEGLAALLHAVGQEALAYGYRNKANVIRARRKAAGK